MFIVMDFSTITQQSYKKIDIESKILSLKKISQKSSCENFKSHLEDVVTEFLGNSLNTFMAEFFDGLTMENDDETENDNKFLMSKLSSEYAKILAESKELSSIRETIKNDIMKKMNYKTKA